LFNNGWGVMDQEAGDVLPNVVSMAWKEILAACNPAFGMIAYNTSQGVANLIQTFGRSIDKEMFLPNLFTGKFNGTMALTESNAGSDLGDLVSKAEPTNDSQVWKISGTKVFISGGDFDIPDNIIHLVLARPVRAAPGTKGLSLFIVPKLWINADGSTEPNDVASVSLEHKLGWKGAATLQLAFGDNNNCRGILLGNPPDESGVGQGMAQMFQMMNGKRYESGRAAVALGTLAYNYAVEYAKVRIQGRALTNPKGPRVRLIEHEDIRRMLLNQKATLEAVKAMIYKAAWYRDIVQYSENLEERRMASRRIEIMTPLIKAYGAEVVWSLVADAIQIHGGYGYSEDYAVARIARDCKLMSIFEGTTYIQSMDLVGRKWSMDKGKVFQEWFDELREYVENNQSSPGLEQEFTILKQSVETYKQIFAAIKNYYADNVQLVAIYATRVLMSTAMLSCAIYSLDMAIVAQKKIAELGTDYWEYPYYQGKVLSARYYIKNVLPQIDSLYTIIKMADTSACEFPEEAF
jgi:alkylation response protein AidB-like acyl-CoA dehydrogenase